MTEDVGHNAGFYVCRICKAPATPRLRFVNPTGALVTVAGAPRLNYQPDDILAIDAFCTNGHKVVVDVTIPSNQFSWPYMRPFLSDLEELA